MCLLHTRKRKMCSSVGWAETRGMKSLLTWFGSCRCGCTHTCNVTLLLVLLPEPSAVLYVCYCLCTSLSLLDLTKKTPRVSLLWPPPILPKLEIRGCSKGHLEKWEQDFLLFRGLFYLCSHQGKALQSNAHLPFIFFSTTDFILLILSPFLIALYRNI